jgi:hypothetical protein
MKIEGGRETPPKIKGARSIRKEIERKSPQASRLCCFKMGSESHNCPMVSVFFHLLPFVLCGSIKNALPASSSPAL